MIPIEEAVAELCDWLGVHESAVLNRRRDARSAARRKLLYWMLYAGGWPVTRIGRWAGRDHTTILRAMGLLRRDGAA